MEDKIKFPANVILIDVAFLNEVVYGGSVAGAYSGSGRAEVL